VPVKSENHDSEAGAEPSNPRDISTSSSNQSSKFSPLTVWKAISTYVDGVFLLFVIALLGICASYIKDVNNSPLAKLFEYSSIGKRLFFTAIGMVVSSQ